MLENGRREAGDGLEAEAAASPEIPADAIREHLSRMLESREFAKCRRLQRLLRFLVERAIKRDTAVKEYCVGVAVFDRDTSFDPRLDPIVRVEARRLRTKLKEYYAREGRNEQLRICLPRGTYLPVFRRARMRDRAARTRKRVLREELSEVKRKLAEMTRQAEEWSEELRALRKKNN